MTNTPVLSRDGRTLIVHVPLKIRRHGGRKRIIVPEGAAPWPPPRARIDNAMVKAVARAFRWRRMMEDGRYGSITELAEAEKINRSYVSRMLRLTLLAPDIVEVILDGRQPVALGLEALMEAFPVEWGAQRECFLARAAPSS